jgi:DNA-directed RNA polymerase subunit beta
MSRLKSIQREYVGTPYEDVIELPNLIGIQLSSYDTFLQREILKAGQNITRTGLEEVFQETFPIESSNGELVLEYDHYTLDESAVKFSEAECKRKRLTYAVPLEG